MLPLGTLSSIYLFAAYQPVSAPVHGEQGYILGSQGSEGTSSSTHPIPKAWEVLQLTVLVCKVYYVVTPGQFWTPEGQLKVALLTTSVTSAQETFRGSR